MSNTGYAAPCCSIDEVRDTLGTCAHPFEMVPAYHVKFPVCSDGAPPSAQPFQPHSFQGNIDLFKIKDSW